ncbi:hypothetical protein [Polynucleobacter sp. JS-JIR-5-A7]|uniref:hypothetical protein n=1 Tax=Polynucleobacter sp. JS-JIR-5-A7 TaxID=1758395 RepID=UPI001BFDE2EB|nr:hypothetical protein [Polynucleobacter sp. JS-JIR-5-A7]QWE06620.1 hypothetical protein AOC29_11110 [Polynucleobacter sp. JS-JIR-5-A7]
MESAWIVFIADDEGFIEGVFDNEEAANDCYKYHDSYMPLATYMLRINPAIFQSTFTIPLDE